MTRPTFDLSISKKVLMLCLLPILMLAGLAAHMLSAEHAEAGRAGQIADVVRLAPAVSGLIHELQRERGISSGFIASKAAGFAEDMGRQRVETDRALAAFRSAFDQPVLLPEGEVFRRPLDEAGRAVAEIEAVRKGISALTTSAPDAIAYYTATIARLLAMTESVSSGTRSPEVIRATTAWNALLHGKELAGRERATGAAGFGAGAFSPEIHRSLLRLAAEQDADLATFRQLATPEEVAAFDASLGDTVQADVDRMRVIAWNAPFGADVRAVPAKAWFAAATRRIDAMKTVEDRVAADIVALADGLAWGAGLRFWGLSVFLAVVGIGTAAFSVILARNITRPIVDLTDWTRRLAENDTDLEIRGQDRHDEIGGMIRALEVLRRHAVDRLNLDETVRTDRDRERERRADMERVVDAFRSSVSSMLVSLETETSTVRATAVALTDLARSAEADAGVVETATAGASSNVQTVAAATEELAASIREIAGQAQRVNAVVAAEVKSLAQQTAQATTEIADHVAGIQTSTQSAVDAIRGISRTVEDIAGVTAVIASAVEEQEAVTREIAASIQSVSDGTAVVVDNMHGVNGVIRAAAGEAGQVNAASDALSLTTNRLSQEVAKFLAEVAA